MDEAVEGAAIAEVVAEDVDAETSANVGDQLSVEEMEAVVAAAEVVEVVFSEIHRQYSWPDSLCLRPIQR